MSPAGFNPFRPRLGTVTAIDANACTVLLSEGEVPAYLNDQTLDAVVIGAVVTLLPIGDTYEVISTRTGTTGGGGVILGPELLPNPSFEFGDTVPTGWAWWPFVAGNYTAARDVTVGEAASGAARMLVTLAPGDVAPVVNIWPATPVRVDSGSTYQFAAWPKANPGDASLVVDTFVITARTATAAAVGDPSATVTPVALVTNPGGAYQLMSSVFTVPTGHAYCRPFMRATASASMASTVSVSWDLASLRQRLTA